MWKCERDYCPHIHDKRCLNGKIKQMIPYTIFPDGTIQSFTNVHIRCTNLYKSNVPTTAYEKYQAEKNQPVDDDRNFVKDYYMQNAGNNCAGISNYIVDQLMQEMGTRSAYILADQQNIQYQKNKAIKQRKNSNARRRAVSRYNDHFRDKQIKAKQDKQENAQWIKRLYRKLEEIASHIINREAANMSERQKIFLLSKSYLNAGYLAKIKVRNPKVAFEILEQIRTLMLKKKMKYEQQREEQQHNKSVSVSFASQGSTNLSAGSFMSQATSAAGSQVFEDQVVGKYCDFEQLQKKWRLQDIEEVKQMIRRILTKEKVSQAEHQGIKKIRQAQKNNQLIMQQTKKTQQKETQKKGKKKTSPKKPKHDPNAGKPVYTQRLNKQQKQIKNTLLKGGQFDAIGQKFQRNRNFSQMFKKRQDQIMPEFCIKDTTLSLNKQSLISTK